MSGRARCRVSVRNIFEPAAYRQDFTLRRGAADDDDIEISLYRYRYICPPARAPGRHDFYSAARHYIHTIINTGKRPRGKSAPRFENAEGSRMQMLRVASDEFEFIAAAPRQRRAPLRYCRYRLRRASPR